MGWLLATWSKNKGTGAGSKVAGNVANPPQTLFLVDPAGGRYVIWRASNSDANLAAWSGDGKRALFVGYVGRQDFIEVDLAKGKATDLFPLPGSSSVFFESVSYTQPDGHALLVTTQTNDRQLLQRFSLDGSVQLTYPDSFASVGRYDGHALETSNGDEVVMGANDGIAVVRNDGTVVHQLHVPGATDCQPASWWSQDVVLASCFGRTSTTRLFEVPIDGGRIVALTVQPSPPDAGDIDAWAIGGSVFVQDAGGCGYIYLAKLDRNGTTTPYSVPSVVRGDSVLVVGEANDQLALQATIACGSGQSALWFNPASNTSTVVLGPPVNGGGVVAMIPWRQNISPYD